MACTYKPYRSKNKQRLNPYWRKKNVLPARVERKKLAWRDVLKNWIDMIRFLNCTIKG
jgi:hypothetical protein